MRGTAAHPSTGPGHRPATRRRRAEAAGHAIGMPPACADSIARPAPVRRSRSPALRQIRRDGRTVRFRVPPAAARRQPLDDDQRDTDADHRNPPRAGALGALAAVAHAEERKREIRAWPPTATDQAECRCPGNRVDQIAKAQAAMAASAVARTNASSIAGLPPGCQRTASRSASPTKASHGHAVRPDAGVRDPVTAQAKPCRERGLGNCGRDASVAQHST